MTGYWITAAVLAVLVLLLAAPVRVHFTYFDQIPLCRVRYLFLTRQFPAQREKKAAKEPKKVKKSGKKNVKEAPKKKSKITGEDILAYIQIGRELLAAAGHAGGFLMRGIRCSALRLEVMTVRSDAYKTAQAAGKLNAAAYSLAALIQNFADIREIYLNIYPGFWAQEETAAFEVKLRLRPARLFGAALMLLGGSIGPLGRYLRQIQEKAAVPEEEFGKNIQTEQ